MREKVLATLLLTVVVPGWSQRVVKNQSDSIANTEKKLTTVNLDPVVVTGSGHHERLKSSVTPVRVISDTDIRRLGTANINEVLTRLVPQISTSPNSTGSYLHLNGLSNRYVLVLVNGRRLIGDLSGNVNLNQINVGAIRRIEVLDGAASTLYGSDAVGGVINIITDRMQDAPLSVTTDTRVGAKGKWRSSANVGWRVGSFTSHTYYTHEAQDYYRNNGYAYKSGLSGDVQPTLSVLTSGYRTNNVSQRFDWNFGKHLSFFAEGDYNWHKTRRPDTNEDTSGGYDYELRDESWRWDAGSLYKWGRRNSVQLRVSGEHYQYGNLYEVATKSYEVGDYVRKKTQREYEAELKGIVSLYEGSLTLAGVDWRNEFLDAVTGQVDSHLYTWGAYLQHEMELTKGLKAVAGVRFTDNEAFGSEFTPKVALRYSSGPWLLRLSYSGGYRAPGLDELYYRYFTFSRNYPTVTLGNESLKPERSNNISVGGDFDNEYISVGAEAFANFVDDMIVKQVTEIGDDKTWLREMFPDMTDAQADVITDYNQYVNSDRGRILGLKAHLTVRPLPGLNFSANYAYIYGRQKSDGVWENLERSIRNTLTLIADWNHQWTNYLLDVSVNGRLQSRTYYPAKYEDAPGYGLWNLNTTHTFQLVRWLVLEASLGVDNIFNTKDKRVYSSLRRWSNFSSGTSLTAGIKLEVTL